MRSTQFTTVELEFTDKDKDDYAWFINGEVEPTPKAKPRRKKKTMGKVKQAKGKAKRTTKRT